MASWIRFDSLPDPSRKTGIWEVRTQDGSVLLGVVKWFGRWRKYAFFPCSETVFEQDCLRDIAQFAEAATKDHRERRKSKSCASA